jgi:hypothetical protein
MSKDDIKKHEFKKGQSGNPTGRPKGIPNTRTRLQRLLAITQDLTNPITGEVEGFTVLEQLDLQQIIKARKGDLAAYKEIIDRLEGKAKQDKQDTNISVNFGKFVEEDTKKYLIDNEDS